MGKIHVGQTALQIIRTLGVDITGATSVKLKYKKPSQKEGEWTATIDDAPTGQISYTVASADIIDEYGHWTVWAWVTLASGKVVAGEATRMTVYKEGDLS